MPKFVGNARQHACMSVLLAVATLGFSPVTQAAECSAHCECAPDRWAYVEYTIGPSGRVQGFQERFASVPGLGKALLEDGAHRGQAGVDIGPGRYEVFQFERPEGSGPVRGRRLSLRNQGVLASPGARGQSGEIAIRLETDGTALQMRDVLFASSPSLQRLVPELVDLLEVKSSGSATESVLDVAFFKIEGGQVNTLTVTSYIGPP